MPLIWGLVKWVQAITDYVIAWRKSAPWQAKASQLRREATELSSQLAPIRIAIESQARVVDTLGTDLGKVSSTCPFRLLEGHVAHFPTRACAGDCCAPRGIPYGPEAASHSESH